jgi:hypothetical protein
MFAIFWRSFASTRKISVAGIEIGSRRGPYSIVGHKTLTLVVEDRKGKGC